MNAGKASSAFERARAKEVAIYNLGRIEQLIADSARGAGIPEDVLAREVAGLLSAQTVREPLGTENHLPGMRPSANGRGQFVEPVEMVDSSPRQSQAGEELGPQELARVLAQQGFSPEEIARKLSVSPQTARTYISKARSQGYEIPKASRKRFSYQGTHWTQQKKNKARLRKQMKKVRKYRRPAAGLSARQQEVFDLRKQGLSYAEIAEKLGVSIGSVRVHLRAARERGAK